MATSASQMACYSPFLVRASLLLDWDLQGICALILTPKESDSSAISEAERLLRDARKQQENARVSKDHADLRLSEALKASLAAQREVDDADMYAGRVLFVLWQRGYPFVLCRGEHHIEVDHGSFFMYSTLYSRLRSLSLEKNTVHLPGGGSFGVVLD